MEKIIREEYNCVSGKLDYVKSKICENVYANEDAEQLKELLRYCLHLLNKIEDAIEKLQTKGDENE